MIRLLMALPLALGMTLGLFTVMAWMIDNGDQSAPKGSEVFAFQMLMVERETQSQRKLRAAPPALPPPPPQKKSPQAKPNVSQMALSAGVSMTSMPRLDLAISGMAINAPTFSDINSLSGSLGNSKQAMPLYRVEPRYPPRALRQGLEGFVLMTFTIDTQGRPIDIVILDSKPRRVFDKEAVRAVRKWKYQPQVQQGETVMQQGQTARLEFKLQK